MVKLTSKQQFAALAMLDIALHQINGPVTLIKIAKRHLISKSYLEQIFSQLRHKNLVKSVHGRSGGYVIKGDLKNITVAQILSAIDIKTSQRKVEQAADQIHRSLNITLQLLWNQLNSNSHQFLNKVKLNYLIEQAKCNPIKCLGLKASDKAFWEMVDVNNKMMLGF